MAVALVIPVGTVASAPALGAAPCKVVNAAVGTTTTSLKAAIRRAAGGATLKATGVCIGEFVVGKDLTLRKGATAGTLKGSSGTTLSVIGLTITGGKAPTCSEWSGTVCGGGIRNDGTLTPDASTVRGNKATGDATGGKYNEGGDIFNEGSGPTDNEREPVGSLTVADSTISGNVAGEGGGIYGGTHPTSISSSTITDNSAGTGPFTSGGHDLLGDNSDCTGFTDALDGDQVADDVSLLDAELGLLAANGGPTKSRLLLPGSPAIDAGGAGPCESGTDQSAVSRPQGGACDTGAIEL